MAKEIWGFMWILQDHDFFYYFCIFWCSFKAWPGHGLQKTAKKLKMQIIKQIWKHDDNCKKNNKNEKQHVGLARRHSTLLDREVATPFLAEENNALGKKRK